MAEAINVETPAISNVETGEKTQGRDEILLHAQSTETSTGDGTKRQKIRGGDIIPQTPMNTGMVWAIIGINAIIILVAFGLFGVGSAMYVLLQLHSAIQGPHVWWSGIPPLLLGISGIYGATNHERPWIWKWSMLSIVILFTQTAVMGVVGNFSSSKYDAWPHGNDTCRQITVDVCYCRDTFHGVYSNVELPGIKYKYMDNIKWRKTRFEACHIALIMGQFFFINLALIASLWVVIPTGAALGFTASIYYRQDLTMHIYTVSTDAAPSDVMDPAPCSTGDPADVASIAIGTELSFQFMNSDRRKLVDD